MRKHSQLLILISLFIIIVTSPVLADDYLESLKPNQVINGFKTLNLYENSSGEAAGARFISEKYGFIIDLMKIESVPQGYFWAKAIPTSSKGEPHACEHLLLGKGNRGRYVAALEDMSLGNSTAGTGQLRTVYHFNTTAGAETFYEIFEAKLNALINPDFTDEEIRREVCHIGVVENPETGELSIDEKGSVYTEMVSGFERPWYHTWGILNNMVYGENHTLTNSAGGDPDVMRDMTTDDMWTFHKESYHLANMGAIVSIPNDISVEDCLKNMSEILPRCQNYEDSSPNPGIKGIDYLPIDNAPIGSVKLVEYPSNNPEDPGYLLYAWPAYLKLDKYERGILSLFMSGFAQGQTSNLYNLFVNSATRQIDIGCQSAYGGIDSDMDASIYFGITGIENKYVSEAMLDSVKNMILAEFEKIKNYDGDSEELKKFNDRLRNRLIDQKKQYDNYLNSPPMFGFRRGSAGGWESIMRDLEEDTDFRKSLIMKDRFAYADSVLNLDGNVWSKRIDGWKVLTDKPYMVGAVPNAELIEKTAQAKELRLAANIEDFKIKYGVDDAQTAIAKYKEEFDANTVKLEAVKSKDKLPGFISNPPMTLDDQLNYQTITLPNGIPLVASSFENMTSANIGIAFQMEVIPESLMVYVPFIPSVLTRLGVIQNGDTVTYDEMEERLRREVLNLGARYDQNYSTERTELILSGQGSNLEELKNVIGWMNDVLYAPFLSTKNISRISDLIDQTLQSYRNRMKRSEEDWVDYPADAYRFQKNPLFMSTNCFLTESHHYQRLKWLLTDPGEDGQMLALILDDIKKVGKEQTREEISEMLTNLEELDKLSDDISALPSSMSSENVSESSLKLISKIATALKATLVDVPDGNLHDDWAYLCDQIKHDLQIKPEYAISQINNILDIIRKSDIARMFMISNSDCREKTLGLVEDFVGKLDSQSSSVIQKYALKDRVINRLKSRETNLDKPLYVGLVHEGTNNGVLLFSAEKAGQYDTTRTGIINCLAGKLYGGGGPHGLFMKTWAAGLAYSNGYSYSQSSGRVSYYAERCPDIAETMRYVVDQMKNADDDPSLIDYAVAQVFGFSRAPSRYESRGRAMAADLAHGRTPEKVKTFREQVMNLKKEEGFYYDLKAQLEEAYGPVLIGYGKPLSESGDGNFFIIGPEPQFESLEKLIEAEEGKQTVYRLYPRDFWITL